jgi:N-glycosylase/DNA lyase
MFPFHAETPIAERIETLPRLLGKPVNLTATLSCGQSFRWRKINSQNGVKWQGVVGSSVVELKAKNNDTSEIDFKVYPPKSIDEQTAIEYFGLNSDLQQILTSISRDPFISQSIDFGIGLRILRQDAWECLASFICAINTNITNITTMVEGLCQKIGNKINSNHGRYHSFPSIERVAKASIADLNACKLGFRSQYLRETARRLVIEEEVLKLADLKKVSYEDAHKALISRVVGEKRLPGVGPKVADCVLLFSLGKTESFPIDTWMEKVIRTKYYELLINSDLKSFLNLDKQRHLSLQTYRKLSKTLRSYFGKYAGYAQEYLYHFARNNPSALLLCRPAPREILSQ